MHRPIGDGERSNPSKVITPLARERSRPEYRPRSGDHPSAARSSGVSRMWEDRLRDSRPPGIVSPATSVCQPNVGARRDSRTSDTMPELCARNYRGFARFRSPKCRCENPGAPGSHQRQRHRGRCLPLALWNDPHHRAEDGDNTVVIPVELDGFGNRRAAIRRRKPELIVPDRKLARYKCNEPEIAGTR